MSTIHETLKDATFLLQKCSDEAYRDAEVLLAYVLKKNRAFLYAYPEKKLSKTEADYFQDLVVLRIEGMPVAYLTGTREFWSLPLKVTQDTLIPRPETELIVELTLALLSEKKEACILDLGTGSGAIALALAYERPHWQIFAVDSSLQALAVAKDNQTSLALHNVECIHSDWFEALEASQKFDAILSNPPYLDENDPHLQQGDLRFEPRQALVAGNSGLESLQIILAKSLARLVPEGLLLLEHGYLQKDAISSMLYDYGYATIAAWQDYQGRDRVSGGRKPRE